MKKTFISLAAAATLSFCGVASAAPTYVPFTIDTTTIPDALGALFPTPIPNLTVVATKLSGSYDEQVAVSSTGLTKAAAVANFGLFTTGSNGALPVGLTGLGTFYGIYALFTSIAQVIPGNSFAGLTGDFKLFMDPGNNTTFSVTPGVLTAGVITTAPGVSTPTNTSDDYLLASSSTFRAFPASFGNLNPPPSFEFVFDNLLLTVADQLGLQPLVQSGKTFFTAPDPFHMTVRINGDIPTLTTAPNTLTHTGGTVSASFEIPEPGSLTLLGLGLAGLALAQRRRKLLK